jgi:hypothetical protein
MTRTEPIAHLAASHPHLRLADVEQIVERIAVTVFDQICGVNPMAGNDKNPRPGRVERRINSARDSLPGERNDLPEGSLGKLPVEPQGDESREPPPNAPTIPP